MHSSSNLAPELEDKQATILFKIPPFIVSYNSWRIVAGEILTSLPEDTLQKKAFGPYSVKVECTDIE